MVKTRQYLEVIMLTHKKVLTVIFYKFANCQCEYFSKLILVASSARGFFSLCTFLWFFFLISRPAEKAQPWTTFPLIIDTQQVTVIFTTWRDSPAKRCQIIFFKMFVRQAFNWFSHFLRICILLFPYNTHTQKFLGSFLHMSIQNMQNFTLISNPWK